MINFELSPVGTTPQTFDTGPVDSVLAHVYVPMNP